MTVLKTKLTASFTKALSAFEGCISKKDLALLVLPNVFLAGGAITSTIAGEEPSDFDLFCKTEEAATLIFNKFNGTGLFKGLQLRVEQDPINPALKRGSLYTTGAKSVNELLDEVNEVLKQKKSAVKYISNNAITLSSGLQVTLRFIGQPEAVFTTFDYEHCKVYFELDPLGNSEPVFCGQSMLSIASRELIYTGDSRFVLSAIARLIKFSKRGWKHHASIIFKLMFSATKVDWTSLKVVEEELNGFYGITPIQVEEVLSELKKKEKFSLEEITDLVEGL